MCNSFAANSNRADWFPGNTTTHTRGLNGLKVILGNLYGLDIKYYVEVNFDGFRDGVDALGQLVAIESLFLTFESFNRG